MIPNAKAVPENILKDSVLNQLAAAYFSLGRQLERKTGCSATRAFILSSLRGGASLNQNQIAKLLGFDRTVVHRTVKSLIREGLLAEKKAPTGRALLLSLTPKGNKFHQQLIQARSAADEKVRQALPPKERATLLRLLHQLAHLTL
jgi:DNA-binding MarR family transcriptional regulator